MKHAKCYRAGYPRPQFVRDNFTLLNGEWDFCFGDSAKKIPPKTYTHKINVPYAYNTEKSGINIQDDYDTVWYKKKFAYSKKKGKKLLLNLDGADYFTDVYLNGKRVGYHEGGYTRFTADLTDYLKADNEIAVRCYDPFDASVPRGKQRHLDRNTGCFYKPTVGIWKSVWLEEVSDTFLESAYAQVKYEDFGATVYYKVANFKKGLSLRVTATYQGDLVCDITTAVLSKDGRVFIELENRKAQLPMKWWSAGNHEQYFDVTYELIENSKVIDSVGSYTALVDYRTDNDRILIDYLPATYLRMVLAQGYFEGGALTATEEELENDVKLIKEMGFNGVRVHQKIEDERFYYFCDMYGLYVWLEMPSAYVFNDTSMRLIFNEWRAAVEQYRGYISIMAFVPMNESWGAQTVLENERQQNFITATYAMTKALVPERIVIGNDGWEHTLTDVATLHNYAQNPESLYEAYEDMEGFLSGKRVKDLATRNAFADGYAYSGQPVIISEFGGIKYSPNSDSWGYGNAAKDENELYERFKSLVKAITKNKKIAGYCYTQFTDVYQETNGLTYLDRTLKLPIEKIKEINSL